MPYYLNLQITRADTRSHFKWAVSLVMADGHFNFPWDLCGHVSVNILTLSPMRVLEKLTQQNSSHAKAIYWHWCQPKLIPLKHHRITRKASNMMLKEFRSTGKLNTHIDMGNQTCGKWWHNETYFKPKQSHNVLFHEDFFSLIRTNCCYPFVFHLYMLPKSKCHATVSGTSICIQCIPLTQDNRQKVSIIDLRKGATEVPVQWSAITITPSYQISISRGNRIIWFSTDQ